MMRYFNFFFLLLFGLSFKPTFSQYIAIEDWRDHLPYAQTHAVTASSSKVFCAAANSLFYFDFDDNTINRITTQNGLSDVEVATIGYNTDSKVLVIAYKNGNIDLRYDDGEIVNVSFLKNSDIIGDKEIFEIDMSEEFAYMSTGIGIVIFNTKKVEIKDTYFVGSAANILPIYDVAITVDTIFACTPNGLYKGAFVNNLADYRNWERDTFVPNKNYNIIEKLDDLIILNQTENNDTLSDTVYTRINGVWSKFGPFGDTGVININYDIVFIDDSVVISQNYGLWTTDLNLNVIDKIFNYQSKASPLPREVIRIEEYYWVADAASGLVKTKDSYHADLYKINSPSSDRAYELDFSGDQLWSVAGVLTGTYQNRFLAGSMSNFQNNNWTNLDRGNQPLFSSVFDIVDVAIDPNDVNRVFAASWGGGLVEIENNEVIKVYDATNLSEHSLGVRAVNGLTFTGGLDFDNDGNLWISNPFNFNLISVLTKEGEWQAFNLQGLINADAAYTKVLADGNNNVWVLQPRDNRIVVYHNSGTPLDLFDDPEAVVLSNSVGSGNLPGDGIMSIAEDLNGEVWVGTNEGIAVFYNSNAIFNGGDYDAQQILIQQDGTTQILLENEAITAIAIDGANRKWIGTQNAGVFLMSADGTEEILHFTVDNSPLFSNFIRSIAIDQRSGEVFFGTDNGLISYRGTATESNGTIDEVTVFPNPVKPGYSGLIAINGLTDGAIIKITDASGGLVYETKSLGGQAVWNAKNFNGQRVSTGVYLIFTASSDGEQTNVSKVMILN